MGMGFLPVPSPQALSFLGAARHMGVHPCVVPQCRDPQGSMCDPLSRSSPTGTHCLPKEESRLTLSSWSALPGDTVTSTEDRG